MSAKEIKKTAPVKKNDLQKYFWHIACGIPIFTCIVLYNLTSADFLNWDDLDFVKNNEIIRKLSSENITKMFSSIVMGNYCPAALFSYALDLKLAGSMRPGFFHTSGLFIHALNTFLVFIFIYKLSNKQIMVAAIVSLLFGIHPMHVESVAWISERRDLLYTFFFLLGLISYLDYLNKNYPVKYLVYGFLFFILSLLSKGQAVVFPVILLVLDLMQRRNFTLKVLLEKVPFFILSLVFGYIAIKAQKNTYSMTDMLHFTMVDRFFIGNHGLLIYIIKLFIPFRLCGYHPYTFSGSSLPMIVYLSPVIVIALGIWIYMKLKTDRIFIGGILFFLLSILPVLQFLPIGETIISERYTYLPYIGLFFVIGHCGVNAEKYDLLKKMRSMAIYILIIFCIVLSFISWNRTKVWKDSISFWTDVEQHYPNNRNTYINRGQMYNELKQYDDAINDFTKGISIDSTFGGFFLNRAIAYTNKQMYQQAIDDYTTLLRLEPDRIQAYMNRGGLYTDFFKEYDKGMEDFKNMLRLDPENKYALTNIGVVYFKKGEFDKAIEQYNVILEKDPTDGKVFYLRAVSYASKNDLRSALVDGKKAKELGFAFDESILTQWESALSTVK